MSRTIMLIPTSAGVGLTSASMGVLRAMERKGVKVSFYKPISQPRSGGDQPDLTSTIVGVNSDVKIGQPLAMSVAESLIGNDNMDELLETVVERYNQINKDADVTLIEGLVPTRKHPFANQVNAEIAATLGAEIVLVATPGTDNPAQLKERIEVACSNFGGTKNKNISGVIINKLNAPVDEAGRTRPDLSEIFDDADSAQQSELKVMEIFNTSPIRVLGCVPWSIELIATRAADMASHLNAEIINEGELNTRRIKSITFCARSLPHMIEHFKPGSLLVTSADRPDVIVAAALAAMNGVEIGAVLLTGGYDIPAEIQDLIKPALETGLPIFKAQGNTWQTSLNLQSFSLEVPADDKERIEFINEHVAGHIDGNWIESMTEGTEKSRRLSPPAFRYQLTEFARKAGKRIVLPEGDEPRTVKAAAICAERGIAECVLLGNPEEIRRVAAQQGVELGAGVTIINSDEVRENYVARLVELRGAKGMTEVVAREKLQDSVFLGTMMLENGEVDGLVSGAVHTTANTIVPPFQIIKTAPDASIVSSVFFMLLPDQVLVYGDCAINPDPTAEQLAEIAIQSADSAAAFGIDPRVAMISYSTGESGKGADVDKVREATKLAQEKRPDLVIDGPLQYDAAIMENVAASKAPNSPVAGKATVFVFPDLNTGNTTYKAVQRSADLVSIGPMLQGMRKPVNDLSRGALVDDIVYTVALTAIQADQAAQAEEKVVN
ncbi:phosphate acetyltransferase [Vibrio sp. 10N.222.54.B12]|uniref:Phosphate acetyltransferase n=1 Tax=Vibrio chagasii TaxID=170679 RepID=A0A7V7NSR9_9VIBR|nr:MULTISPECIES: phosphate acetyltransferase [Vibrio]KAB0478999.1 phosphate acetyltransferase [Vibrio chagasii]MBJ2147958.1 phosphate acetyltransferase [Vibrio sp. IB15]MCG9560584.1 phosphate acetyltransferase [Vibrio chagasii]MCG9566535.1 phosphate acetyltransferase [Vibrio chagasii]MCG9676252.1 phosphate acetyltransferase [Vibrio chagasii]